MWIERANIAVAKALMVFAAFVAFSLAFYILVDVIARNLSMPIHGTAEVVTELIVTIVFLQISYCVSMGGMLRADFLVNFFNPKVRVILNIAGYSLGILFFATVFLGNVEPAYDSWVTGEFEGEGSVHVPTFPARFGLVIGCLLAAFSYLLFLIKELMYVLGARQTGAEEP